MDCAWATLVMRSELYACGALALGASLRRGGTQADLVCMVGPGISPDVQDALGDVWDHVVEVPLVEARRGALQRHQRRFGHMYNPWLQHCLTKFSILAMAQYRKVAFLDADMLCVALPPPPPPPSLSPGPQSMSSLGQAWSHHAAGAVHMPRDPHPAATSRAGPGNGLERIRGHGAKGGTVRPNSEDQSALECHRPSERADGGGLSPSEAEQARGMPDVEAAAAGEHVDDLFRVPAPAGILDLYRKDLEKNAAMHGRPVPRTDVRRALSSQCYAMRGCVLLLEPDPRLFEEIKTIAGREPVGEQHAMAGPDEYFITRLYLEKGATWHHLHMRYGMISWAPAQLASTSPTPPPPVFLHYVSEKPWGAPAPSSHEHDRSSGGTPSASGEAQNWEDFRHWDAVVSSLVLPELAPPLADRLLGGWRQRIKKPYVPSYTDQSELPKR